MPPTPKQCCSLLWRPSSWCMQRNARASHQCGIHGRASWPTSKTSRHPCRLPPSRLPPLQPLTPSSPASLQPCTSQPACPLTPRSFCASLVSPSLAWGDRIGVLWGSGVVRGGLMSSGRGKEAWLGVLGGRVSGIGLLGDLGISEGFEVPREWGGRGELGGKF